jgi:hypothetical protein
LTGGFLLEMTDFGGNEELKTQLNSLLEVHSWQIQNGTYLHKDGVKLVFSTNKNFPKSLLSPTSLISYENCPRRLYLIKNPENSDGYYLNLLGEKSKLSFTDQSFSRHSGIIIHKILAVLGSDIVPNVSQLKGLGWRTLLAPIIHYSIYDSLASSPPYIIKDFEIDVNHLEKKITKIIEKIWIPFFFQIQFNPKYWKDYFKKLSIKCEIILKRDDMVGIADLIMHCNNDLLIVDYKTGSFIPKNDTNIFSAEETFDILQNPYNELHSYIIQLTSYCWMLSEKDKCNKAWLVFISEEYPRILQFTIGEKAQEFIAHLINQTKNKINEMGEKQGKYYYLQCGLCSFKLNCPEFLKETFNLDFNKKLQEIKTKLPILSPIIDIFPDTSIVKLQIQTEELIVHIVGSKKNYLLYAKEIMLQGNELIAYMEVFGSIHGLMSSEICFVRRSS